MNPSDSSKPSILEISEEDLEILRSAYSHNSIEPNQIKSQVQPKVHEIIRAYNAGSISDETILSVLGRYNTLQADYQDSPDSEGEYEHEVDMNETSARYAGYSSALARRFRFLGFSSKLGYLARRFHYLGLASDFGEAMRPVASTTFINTSLFISVGYCFVDVAWEAYKLKHRNYHTEKGEPMSMTQCVVQRSTFQLVASMLLPTVIIQSVVDLSAKYASKFKRFTKWGPTLAGLSVIPLLPLYLDPFVEKALNAGFSRFGPWRRRDSA